jgi:hypothetical protein
VRIEQMTATFFVSGVIGRFPVLFRTVPS